mmetsp:Transcript_6600/g.16470  ORF Transcript_6600/g.16470 Transcript_6600/m.16470 type:complete len:154 (+) Transcript_6600:2213-2674(+)
MITMVLGTDMAFHFESVGTFKNRVGGSGFDPKVAEDRTFVLKLGLHCADISNPVKPPVISKQWTDRVMEEFYQQGDKERALGMPISPFYDREKDGIQNVGKCQIGFIDFIIKPLYEVWAAHFPECSHCLDYLSQNRQYWSDGMDEDKKVTSPR